MTASKRAAKSSPCELYNCQLTRSTAARSHVGGWKNSQLDAVTQRSTA